ncbi:MAG: transposase [Lachnospiraceae bacterium]|nr:transposase [Lachnospiraceae bacterium]
MKMTEMRKKASFRLLFLIATPKLVNKAVALLKEGDIPTQYLIHGQGTASSQVMDMLGLDGVDKNILMGMMPKAFADGMLIKLRKKLHLGMPNTGIAFTLPLSGSSGRVVQLMEGLEAEDRPRLLERRESGMTENEYSMIMAIVNQGFSEDVMNAARPKGASGGTVFHSRRIGNEEAMKFWKISVQEEREIVIILAQKEDKKAIMQAIGENCGMESKAQGIILSLPVDGIVGLE